MRVPLKLSYAGLELLQAFEAFSLDVYRSSGVNRR
jgi:hypothetical protein